MGNPSCANDFSKEVCKLDSWFNFRFLGNKALGTLLSYAWENIVDRRSLSPEGVKGLPFQQMQTKTKCI